ncbi:rhomboid-like protein [Amycolatopsis sp. H20-H5]|uniref:rhomboid-like protein n=1 Tax=Amycolatopsis sp. H20-H5 TaxID=3046309 RepID=UPI002DB6F2AB|nr:rhomboid-like protein [Amycolatopsis sp. H20-H5]MEC3976335.1 rhomboid-like protein [Amycolatopsis sp. H20-H5]
MAAPADHVRGTACYLGVLLITHLLVANLPAPAADSLLHAISTAPADVDWWFPVRLFAGALVVDTSGDLLNVVLIVVAGVAFCLGLLEHRLGTARAFGIFLTVHVVVTLLTLLLIAVADYPAEVRTELDYGVSYGALGAAGAATWFLPRWTRVPWAAFILLYPLTAADWYGRLPDVTTCGHVLSAALGLGLGLLVRAHRVRTAGENVG